MGRRSRTKYIRGHGYIRYLYRSPSIDSIHGDGLGDIFSSIFKAGSQVLTKIPSKLIEASKNALVNVGSSTIKAVGSKVGDTIANKITSKNVKPPPIPEQEMRRQILKELMFEQPVEQPPEPDTSDVGLSSAMQKKFYGSGRKRSKLFTGGGIKIL
jgi:hypothetical protein